MTSSPAKILFGTYLFPSVAVLAKSHLHLLFGVAQLFEPVPNVHSSAFQLAPHHCSISLNVAGTACVCEVPAGQLAKFPEVTNSMFMPF